MGSHRHTHIHPHTSKNSSDFDHYKIKIQFQKYFSDIVYNIKNIQLTLPKIGGGPPWICPWINQQLCSRNWSAHCRWKWQRLAVFRSFAEGRKIKHLSKYWGGGSSTQDDPCRSNIGEGVATSATPAALTHAYANKLIWWWCLLQKFTKYSNDYTFRLGYHNVILGTSSIPEWCSENHISILQAVEA